MDILLVLGLGCCSCCSSDSLTVPFLSSDLLRDLLLCSFGGFFHFLLFCSIL
jgi:hypothetical protein